MPFGLQWEYCITARSFMLGSLLYINRALPRLANKLNANYNNDLSKLTNNES